MEFTLFRFDVELILQESLENLVDMGDVVRHVFRKNENVIQVNKHKTVDEVPQHIVYNSLKQGWRIGEPEVHNKEFKMP